MDLLDKVRENNLINNLFEKKDKLLVCVSTGSDSMCLLDILMKLKNELDLEINVAHVNHCIREESNEEEEYITEYCKNNEIKLFVIKEDVIKLSSKIKKGIEETARIVRYDFFNKICNENNLDKILIAHNLNDNIETIILNIIRGCGIKGLNGMEYIKDNIVRPLINIDKKDIVKYCKDNNIKYFEDKTNMDNTYSRNKIRNKLIPLLEEEYNSNIKNSLIRLSNLSKLDEEFIDNYVMNFFNNNLIETNNEYIIFDYKNLNFEMKSIRYRTIRMIIQKLIGNVDGIENIHIDDILKLLETNIKNKKYIIGNKFCMNIIEKNILKIERMKHG